MNEDRQFDDFQTIYKMIHLDEEHAGLRVVSQGVQRQLALELEGPRAPRRQQPERRQERRQPLPAPTPAAAAGGAGARGVGIVGGRGHGFLGGPVVVWKRRRQRRRVQSGAAWGCVVDRSIDRASRSSVRIDDRMIVSTSSMTPQSTHSHPTPKRFRLTPFYVRRLSFSGGGCLK